MSWSVLARARRDVNDRSSVPPIRCGENVPNDHEHRCDRRSQHNAVHAEDLESAQRGDQHHVVGHLGIGADQDRTHEIVHQDDDEGADAIRTSPSQTAPVTRK